jgi:hypothetical protein
MSKLMYFALVAIVLVSISQTAVAKPDFGSNCISCHGSSGGGVEVQPQSFVEMTTGQAGQIVFNVTDIPNPKAALAITGLGDLGATLGSGWTDQGGYYTSDSLSATGSVVMDLTLDPTVNQGDYNLGVQLAGKGMWGTALDYSVSVVTDTTSAVPEPATIGLLALGGLAVMKRRRK